MLKSAGCTLAVAESCTGGLVSHLLTCVPGSSEVFLFGAVTYSNEAKETVLGVDRGLLGSRGAVSEEVAEAMARGVRASSGSTMAVATTGIAGPGGGTRDKPVGTVCVGFACPEGVESFRLRFWGSRLEIKLQSTEYVLEWTRRYCEQKIG